MKGYEKYTTQFYNPPVVTMDWAKKDHIEKAPIWCSVDLRDGNQALIIPMSLDEKIEFYKTLLKVGFKEIEVGFPAASETEYEFCRTLIDNDLIPDDVTIQVLTQAREHIVKKTFEALDGCKNAIVHLYNSTSVAQREQVFHKDKDQIKKLAVDGAEMCKYYRAETEGNFRFEYSPESFTGTEPEYALEVCNAVSEVWKPSPDDKVIYNLPVTVELSMPHVYANQIEYMSKNLNYRENIILSLHPHNDRGCGVADTEMGLLAGADRVEGTLFGNGERTGNADIVTIGMNMYSQGVDPELDFSNLPKIQEVYEKVTRMTVPPRSPYCGQLVFSAFSGSHQDAIAKGMKYREEKGLDTWTVPYLPLDPTDVGRDYDSDVIRVNSQSGRGGIGYILESQYKYDLPKAMRGDFSYQIKEISDHEHRELKADEIFKIFEDTFVNKTKWLKIVEYHFVQEKGGVIGATVTLDYNGHLTTVEAKGNGRLDAVSNAIKTVTGNIFTLDSYNEHSIERKQSDDTAAAYVGIVDKNGNKYWGVGTNHDIINASVKALASAINNELE
ncbi:MAG: 2-isopropylmalate synthase [Acutalibacteraceae bacterium]|nr:2-isopropylmalate synthase [Acutalibacteraceae bacterium]